MEVAIYGEPGSYVGLAGIDRAFYTMQAGNDLSYAKVRKQYCIKSYRNLDYNYSLIINMKILYKSVSSFLRSSLFLSLLVFVLTFYILLFFLC